MTVCPIAKLKEIIKARLFGEVVAEAASGYMTPAFE
jgi:hypothetical protein